MPIPNSTPQEHEATEHSYYFLNTSLDEPTLEGRWTSGPSLDGRSEFSKRDKPDPLGQKPSLGKARPHSGTQTEQQK
jgi:Mn-containing catalase